MGKLEGLVPGGFGGLTWGLVAKALGSGEGCLDGAAVVRKGGVTMVFPRAPVLVTGDLMAVDEGKGMTVGWAGSAGWAGALRERAVTSSAVCLGARDSENAVGLPVAGVRRSLRASFGRTLVSHDASSREEAEAKNDAAGTARVTPDP